MSALIQEHVYRYPFASQLDRTGASCTLRLATSRPDHEADPPFFEGRLANPKRTAELLRAIMTVVRSRFHVPAAMLQRILAEADPVVTANDDRLRFEGFSACCGAYARLDLLDRSFSHSPRNTTCQRGTTNVDFNQPMLAALARMKQNDHVTLAVGADAFVLKRKDTEIIERKVKLPVRWMKGFVEVQSIQSRMRHVHRIGGMHAMRFLRSLPRMKTHRRETFVTRSGQGLRLSQVASRDAVRVGGLERLRVLEALSRDAESLDVYSDETTGCSAWTLTFADCRFHLVISPEVWRGFSGEGQALASLAAADKTALPHVRAALQWQSIIIPETLLDKHQLSETSVDVALKTLGARGLVGFDLSEHAYFHRELPFDLSQVERLQPRLISARKLIDQGKIRCRKHGQTLVEFDIDGTGVQHRVVIPTDENMSARCSCPWHNKHGTERGPCKHILAAQIQLEESHPEAK